MAENLSQTTRSDQKKRQQTEKKTGEKKNGVNAGLSGSFQTAALSAAVTFGGSQLAEQELYAQAVSGGNQMLLQALMMNGERQAHIDEIASITADMRGVPVFSDNLPVTESFELEEPFSAIEIPDFRADALPVIDFSQLEMLAQPFIQGVGFDTN